MAKRGSVQVNFNQKYFDEIMKSAGVERVTRATAEKVRDVARATAPVKTGAYRDGIVVRRQQTTYRTVHRVVGRDPKTLLVEAKTGNLARALKSVKKSG